MAVVAGSTIFFGACHKKPLPEPQHDTTYVWGKNNWSAVQPLDQKVPASADSASVRYIYLLNDGNSWTGTPTSWILRNLNMIIEPVSLENRHKVRGAGTLHDVGILQDKDVLDSIALSQMGFQFGMVHYGNYDRSSYGRQIMLKHFAIFLFFATICIDCANATGTCSAMTNNCESGEWCETQTEADNTISYVCSGCTNGPTDPNNKACGDSNTAWCQYTGNGGNSNNCPWEMTCSNGTVFVPAETACKTCNEIIENANNHYVSNLGAASSYKVMWNGTIFSYMVSWVIYEGDGWGSEPVYPTENPATCVGKPYEVNINCNGGTGCPTKVYRQYGNETDWWQTSDIYNDEQPKITDLPLPSRKRHLFQGYYLDPDNDDTQIFGANGQLKPAGNTLISGTATLFAKWVLGGNYTIIVDDECGSLSNFNSSCSCANTYCDLNHSFDGTRYNGKEFHWDTDNCGTLSSDFHKFYLSDDCDIDNGDSIEITLTCTSCPAGSYCKSGQITSCPTNTTSFAGSYEKSACHYYSGTVFRDSVGSFSLPVGEDGIITVKWDY